MRPEEQALWKERFRDYLQLLQRSARTVEGYLSELHFFLLFLAEQQIRSLPEVTRDTLETYRTHIYYARHRDQKLSLNTQSKRISVVKTFFRFLLEGGFVLIDPATQLKNPRVPRPLPRYVPSEKELERILLAPDVTEPLGLRDRAMLEVLYASAVRNSELLALKLTDFMPERRELAVRCGKGGRSRLVPLGEEAVAWMDQYLSDSRPWLLQDQQQDAIFLSCRGRPLVRRDVTRLVREAAEAAGLERRVTPHQLRHACATHMLHRGCRIRHLQVLLGHESLSSTQRYTKVEIQDLHRVHRKFHPRERRR